MKTLTQKLPLAMLAVALMLILTTPVMAQQSEPALDLYLNRDFGYGGFSGDIEGLFTVGVRGPDNLVSVTFYIDDQVMLEDTEAPFSYQFNTNQYGLGEHTLHAEGLTSDGQLLQSETINRLFVEPAEGYAAAGQIIIPILVLVAAISILSFAIPMLTGRKAKPVPLGAQRNYGIMGGTICKNCHRPFPMSLLGSNLVVGRLERCPHCGKWGLMRRYPLDVLRAAEQAESELAPKETLATMSEEERLRKELESSRYE